MNVLSKKYGTMAEYITREAAIEAVKQSTGVGNTAFIDRFDALNRIGIIPAADVQPVRHGRWIEDAKTYYEMLNDAGMMVDEYTPYFTDDVACSVCLSKYNVCDNETQFFKYGPNCGAKMDKEEE